MKFLISGYGKNTGTDSKPFRTLRLQKKAGVGTVYSQSEAVSYRGKNKEDAVVIDCTSRKVNADAKNNDVRLFIHGATAADLYRLAEQLVELADRADRRSHDAGYAKPSPEREVLLRTIVGGHPFPSLAHVSEEDFRVVIGTLLSSVEYEDCDLPAGDPDGLGPRIEARRRLLCEILKTFDASIDYRPGVRIVKTK